MGSPLRMDRADDGSCSSSFALVPSGEVLIPCTPAIPASPVIAFFRKPAVGGAMVHQFKLKAHLSDEEFARFQKVLDSTK
ncbi:MAG: hypothetical protein A2603_03010 [Bdellovibrionales bacterium RIFOXYD1_FULL_55_31]|nr:MAG: hypothetical protein A2603_03010 [Bdellovibrionales bacterium RIFOXYD1_FULL_55_31]